MFVYYSLLELILTLGFLIYQCNVVIFCLVMQLVCESLVLRHIQYPSTVLYRRGYTNSIALSCAET